MTFPQVKIGISAFHFIDYSHLDYFYDIFATADFGANWRFGIWRQNKPQCTTCNPPTSKKSRKLIPINHLKQLNRIAARR